MADEAGTMPREATRGERSGILAWLGTLRERGIIGAVLWPLLSTVVFIAIWHWLSTSGIVDETVLPAPGDVLDALITLGNTYFFWEATWVTTQESILGFVIGVAAAYLVGTAIGLFRWVSAALYPLIVAIEIVPRVALAPVFLTWFGFGISSKVMMAAAICFFPVLINVILGLESVSRDARDLMRSMGASKWEEYRMLLFPSSLPAIFASLKIAITFALTGAIVAEFVGANEGMAVLIKTFNFQLNVAESFAVIVALSILGIVFYGVTLLLESRIVFWRTR